VDSVLSPFDFTQDFAGMTSGNHGQNKGGNMNPLRCRGLKGYITPSTGLGKTAKIIPPTAGVAKRQRKFPPAQAGCVAIAVFKLFLFFCRYVIMYTP